jgi:hypothetical protein
MLFLWLGVGSGSTAAAVCCVNAWFVAVSRARGVSNRVELFYCCGRPHAPAY